MTNSNALDEFKDIYRRTYGKEISDKDATNLSTQLIRLYKEVLLADHEKLED